MIRPVVNGMVTLQKPGYLLTLDFSQWLEKLPYDQYVLIHSQDRPVGDCKWGILEVNSGNVICSEACKIESCQPHEGWKLTDDVSGIPPMAVVYPACTSEIDNKGTASICSIGFVHPSKAKEQAA
ncbi:hypothetical protein U2F10_25750 [Leptothoe sp. EHU-05/26/07-4]